ncbi:hypothetical protein ONZ45_g17744 [Pleurotus djamor]|nr:hypothetical protein ONZ45_g17744 [Pleurotus djamor]
MVHQDIRDFGGTGADLTFSAKAFAVLGLTQITMQYVVYLLADLMLLWRAYVIFQGSLVAIALPAVLMIGMTVTCFLWLGHYFTPMHTMQGNNLEELFVHLRSFKIHLFHLTSVVLSALTNVTLTVMIAGRLFYQQWSLRKHFGFTTLMFESLVIVESGMLYTIGWFMYIFTFPLKHNASAIIMDSMAELAGIVPVLIIVAVVLGISPASAQSSQSHTALAFAARPSAAVDPEATLDDASLEHDSEKSTTLAGCLPESPSKEVA